MNYELYRMYVEQKRLIRAAEACKNEHGDDELNLIADMKVSHAILDERNPEYPRRYQMEQEMFASFNQDQINFICAQIGHWYVMMKPLLEGTHNLGHMKEVLKTMICGD